MPLLRVFAQFASTEVRSCSGCVRWRKSEEEKSSFLLKKRFLLKDLMKGSLKSLQKKLFLVFATVLERGRFPRMSQR